MMVVKLLRINRLSNDFIASEQVFNLVSVFMKQESRDEKISNERFIANNIKII